MEEHAGGDILLFSTAVCAEKQQLSVDDLSFAVKSGSSARV
jgi:hypothetical protein